jgi:thioredoxin 1
MTISSVTMNPAMKPRFGSSAVKTVNDNTFQAEVLNAKEAVIVDFYADWCPPCQRLKPMFEQMASEYQKAGKPIKFVKMNIDDSSATANKYGVSSIPTLIVFKAGQEGQKVVGLPSKNYLKAMVDSSI